jgi:hypothetical protein
LVVPLAISAVIALANTYGDQPQANNQVAARLTQLHKPMAKIKVEANSGIDAPPNLARPMMDTGTTVVVNSDDLGSIFPPDRYTTCFKHRPLYFQELNLERCGTTYGCAQNAVSAAYFIGNSAILPYRMAIDRADECVNHWDDCSSCKRYSSDIEPLKPSFNGTVNEAAAIAGFVFLLL